MEWQLTGMGTITRRGGEWEAGQGQCSKAEEFDLDQFTKASGSSVAALRLALHRVADSSLDALVTSLAQAKQIFVGHPLKGKKNKILQNSVSRSTLIP